jgi:hypothetical protein
MRAADVKDTKVTKDTERDAGDETHDDLNVEKSVAILTGSLLMPSAPAALSCFNDATVCPLFSSVSFAATGLNRRQS